MFSSIFLQRYKEYSYYSKLKALVGMDRSFPLSTVSEFFSLKTNNWKLKVVAHNYFSVQRVKVDKNYDFCVITLEKSVPDISPLCLPTEPSDKYMNTWGSPSGSFHRGKSFGFGYTKQFQNEVKQVGDVHMMKQRMIGSKQFDVIPISECKERYPSPEFQGELEK